MLFHLYTNGEHLKKADFEQRYLSFFNYQIDNAAADECISLLLDNRLAFLDNGCLLPTDAGRKVGSRAQVDYYFTEGIRASDKSLADKKYKESLDAWFGKESDPRKYKILNQSNS